MKPSGIFWCWTLTLAVAQETLTFDQATEKAVGLFNDGEALSPSAAGSILMREAIVILQQVHVASPDHFHAAFFLGMMHQRLDEPSLAAKAYRAAVAVDHRNADALNNLGKALSDLGQGSVSVLRKKK